jgi:hypothetical protein
MATDSPAATRRAPAARVSRPYLLTSAVVALHVAAVTWLSSGGGLYIDDIRAQAYAAGRSFYPFVIESNRTHLAPGARTIDWFMARHAPLEHWPAVVVTALIALLLGYATARLVSRVIAHPTARGLAIAWVLFAASVIPTYAWFRQAITVMLPLGLLLLLASLVLDHLRSGRWPLLGAALGLHALALTFSERALAVPFVVLALIVVVDGVRWRSARWWTRSAARLGPFVAVNVLFLLVYLGGDYDKAEGSQPSLSDAAVKIGRWALVDLLPSFLGGPVVWRSANGAYSFADTPTWLVAAAATLFALLLVVAVYTRGSLRAAGPVALVTAAYAVPVLGMIYVFRLAQVEDITAADDLRLLPDVSAAVALALAALVGTVLERRPVRRTTEGPSKKWTVGLGALAATCALLCTITWVGFGMLWHTTVVPDYLANLRAEVRATTGQALPAPVPAEIIPGWVDPGFTTGPLIELLNPDALSAELSGAPEVVGPAGSLVPAELGRVAGSELPEGFCGQVLPVGVRTVTIPLVDDAPYYRGSIVVVGVLIGDAERLNLRVTDREGAVSGPLIVDPPELLRGPHRIFAPVPLNTAVRSVTVEVETANTDGVCVTSAQVNTVGPLP